jgi:Ca2+-binding EF-hand superfamily protein
MLENLNSPRLFSRADGLLWVSANNKVCCWENGNWREAFTATASEPPEVFEDRVTFRSVPSSTSNDPAELWLWQPNNSAPELCLRDPARPHPSVINMMPPKLNDQGSAPFWRSLPRLYLASSPVMYFRSNLYFLVDHANVLARDAQLTAVKTSGDAPLTAFESALRRWTVSEKDGCHAQLVCLSRDCPRPIILPMRFDPEQGLPPLRSLAEKVNIASWLTPSPLMHVADGSLYIGQQDLGIWTLPIAQVETAVAQQKDQLKGDDSRRVAAAAALRKTLLEKYDRNGNGLIDDDEKESALADPDFIEQELDAIDANHNGCLDADELAWFDANHNKTLDADEQAGIAIAQHLFAVSFLMEFDADGDGLLDRSEFGSLFSKHFKPAIPGFPMGPQFGSFPDRNRDGFIDVGELETFLNEQTRRGFLRRRNPATPVFRPPMTNSISAPDPQQALKAAVELYWQNPGWTTNRPGPP